MIAFLPFDRDKLLYHSKRRRISLTVSLETKKLEVMEFEEALVVTYNFPESASNPKKIHSRFRSSG